MLLRFSLYGFLKNQRYFEPFLILAYLQLGLSFFEIGLLIGPDDAPVHVFDTAAIHAEAAALEALGERAD